MTISVMIRVMPMRATTVRFSEDLWQLLDDESTMQGISAAQFVRDATIVRLAYLAGRRGDSGSEQSIEAIAERAARRHQQGHAPSTAVQAPERLAALHRTELLDSPAQENFDRLTRLTSTVLNVPVALVSLVDSDRQFFKSCLGLAQPWASQRQTPLSHSFCQHVVQSGRPLVVSDAREHPLLRDNPAIRDLGVMAYAGAPLIPNLAPMSSAWWLGYRCVLGLANGSRTTQNLQRTGECVDRATATSPTSSPRPG
jgi:hypothetical protein